MNKVLAVFWIVFATVAGAEPQAKFTRLRDNSEPVGGLGAFLDKFVGDCNPNEGGSCQQAVRDYRSKMRGKKMVMVVSEDSAGMVQPGGFDEGRGTFSVNITPFFPASGYALTQGAPKKTDSNGNPIMPFVTVSGKIPEGWDEMRFNRLFTSREIRLNIVFSPQDVWALPKRGGGKLQGVRAKIDGIQVVASRSGETLATWVH